jgi:hypothetical protein
MTADPWLRQALLDSSTLRRFRWDWCDRLERLLERLTGSL